MLVNMRIVFVGAVRFSRFCLERVLRCGGHVVGVITLRPERAGFHADFADLGEVATDHGVPVFRIDRINDPESVRLLRDLRPDAIFVFGFSQILSKEVLDLPPLGCIGSHPSLLPRGRGRHPLVWALVKGLSETGLTFFYLEEGVDSGDILWQRSLPITWEDDAGTLYEKIEGLAGQAIEEFLPQLAAGTAPRVPQDHALATYYPKRGEEDGAIRWAGSSGEIYNLVRALTRPYVGAHTWMRGERVAVWKCRPCAEPWNQGDLGEPPGTIVASGRNGLKVHSGDGFVEVTDYSASGGLRPAFRPGQRFDADPRAGEGR